MARLASLADTNSFISWSIFKSAVNSLWICSTVTEFSRSAVMVDLRYVFSRLKVENDRSAEHEEDGKTKKSFTSLATSSRSIDVIPLVSRRNTLTTSWTVLMSVPSQTSWSNMSCLWSLSACRSSRKWSVTFLSVASSQTPIWPVTGFTLQILNLLIILTNKSQNDTIVTVLNILVHTYLLWGT